MQERGTFYLLFSSVLAWKSKVRLPFKIYTKQLNFFLIQNRNTVNVNLRAF